MFKAGRYLYVIYMCHLSVEKLLKGLYEATFEKIPLKTRNLICFYNAINMKAPEDHLKTIETLNDLTIMTRHPGDIEEIVRAYKKDRVGRYLKRTKELLKWLKKDTRLRR